jgi:predicted nucleic acid-binding protein
MILDTNALSAWADGNPACRPAFAEASRLVVPVIVLGEYHYGIRQSRHRSRYEDWLTKNLLFAEIQPFNQFIQLFQKKSISGETSRTHMALTIYPKTGDKYVL